FWGGTKLKDMEEIQAQHAWQEYQYRGRTECRLLRILIVMLLLAVLFGCLWIIVRPYVSPARGQFAFFTTWTIEYLSLTMIALLTLYVADRTRLCVQFVLSLAKTQTIWTDIAYKWKPVKNRKLEPEDAADYIDVLVIAKHTEVIGHMVLYPFIAIALLLVSRNSYFDNWGWPLFMIIFFTIMIGYAMTCAIVLRRAAEKSQTRAIRRLQNRLLGAFGDQDKARADQIENLIEEIRNIRQGAYSPWSQRPEIKALVPLGGVALIGILEILSLYGL
ncbi:MAG: hypothetical protein O7G85_14990, partial [Planctomycetota bacterium]|nr:hypothetical protein [Planctomycetota bacterium]